MSCQQGYTSSRGSQLYGAMLDSKDVGSSLGSEKNPIPVEEDMRVPITLNPSH